MNMKKHYIIIFIFIIGITISAGIKLANIDNINEMLDGAEPKTVSYMLHSLQQGVPVPGPGDNKLLQSFVCYENNLNGIIFTLKSVDNSNINYKFTLYDSNMSILRSIVSKSVNGQITRVDFSPLDDSKNKTFLFSLETSSASDSGRLQLRIATPRITYPVGYLYVNKVRQYPYVAFFLTVHNVRTFVSYCNTIGNYFSLELLLLGIVIAYVGYLHHKLRAVLYVILFFGLIQVFIEIPFSGVDEGAHLDNINYIYNHNKLPYFYDHNDANDLFNLKNSVGNLQSIYSLSEGVYLYESAHPPLYYMFGAGISHLLSLISDSMPLRFYFLRFTGVLMIMLTAYLIIKTYNLLVAYNICRKNDLVMYLLLLLFFCSPGFLNVLVAVTNEQMILPLVAYSFYLMVSYIVSDKRITTSTILICSLLSASVILTKLTAAPAVIILALFVIITKNIRFIFIYFISVAALVAPWFIYNYITYGKLTMSMANFAFAVPDYRDRYLSCRDLLNISYDFVMNYFVGHKMSGLLKLITSCYKYIYPLTIIYVLYNAGLFFIKQKHIKFMHHEKTICYIAVTSIISQVLYLLAASKLLNFSNMQARYTFGYVSIVVILLYMLITKINYSDNIENC
jgi:hypothetical protein